MTKRIRPKIKLYPVIARAVEEGVAYGIRHAFKHHVAVEADLSYVEECVEREVLNALCEVLEFDDD